MYMLVATSVVAGLCAERESERERQTARDGGKASKRE